MTQIVNWEPMFAACCASERYFVDVLSFHEISNGSEAAICKLFDVTIGAMLSKVAVGTIDVIAAIEVGLMLSMTDDGIIVDMIIFY